MNKDKYASIINISSMAGQMTSHNMSVYGSSKAAINQLTKEMEEKMLVKTPLKVLGETKDIAQHDTLFCQPSFKMDKRTSNCCKW